MDTGIQDLEPEGATLEKKSEMNLFLTPNVVGIIPDSVALRIARVNHACQPNAEAVYDETARVAILYALKDIHPGQEISRCYIWFLFHMGVEISGMSLDCTIDEVFNFAKNKELIIRHGIICPIDCFCNEPATRALVDEGRRLNAALLSLHRQFKTKEALVTTDRFLDIHRRLNVSWSQLAFAYTAIFQVAVVRSEFLPKAKEYMRSAVELFTKMYPYSKKITKKFENLIDHPEMSSNYLVIGS